MAREYEARRMKVICHKCGSSKDRLPITIQRSRKKNGGHYVCASCKAKDAAKKRPQCKKTWWTKSKRENHGKIMKESEKYYAAIETRDNSGEKIPCIKKAYT